MRPFPLAVAAVVLAGSLSLTGCGGSQGSLGGGGGRYTPPPGQFSGLAFTGKVLAGATPISGASVQLYAAGTAGNGSGPTLLLSSALPTDASGTFSVAAGSYSCPVAESVLYVVATAGAVSGGKANGATELMTVPGSCTSLMGSPSFVVNEMTTVGSVYALRPFLARGAKLGSSATNAGGLALGMATLSRLVNLSAGTAPGVGFPQNGTAPVPKLNTLANILHVCVASTGTASTACTSLFSSAAGTAATNTLDAALEVANSPGANVAALYGLSTASAVFSPSLSAAPPDWTLVIPFTGGGMNAPASVAVDSAGNVWLTNYFSVASLFSNSGAPVFASGVTGYGLNESYGGAVDGNDVAWIANQENTDYTLNGGFGSITLLNSTGPAFTGDSQYASGGLNYPVSVAIDSTNTAWIVDYGNGHLTLLSDSGVSQSGASGYASDQFAFPVAVAVDSKRNGWVANQSASTVTKVSADGSSFTSYTVGNGPSGVAVDAADNVWSANYYGDTLGLISASGQVVSGGGFAGGGLAHPVGIEADGAGTVWVANYRGPGISEFTGVAATTPGTALSPSAGWGPDASLLEAYGLAIDAAGNIWVSSFGDNRLVEFVGIASPVKTPLLGATRIP